MQKQLSVGVLNPTINAFTGLIKSVIVPSAPTCNIPLGNISIVSGQVMPLSDLDNSVCQSASDIRTAFPVISVLVNFGLALSLFYLIGRIVNNLTNKNENDLVGGV